jgi:hypothetical protein
MNVYPFLSQNLCIYFQKIRFNFFFIIILIFYGMFGWEKKVKGKKVKRKNVKGKKVDGKWVESEMIV